MGPVRQNPIQTTVKSVHMCVQFTVHNCAHNVVCMYNMYESIYNVPLLQPKQSRVRARNRPDNFPSYPPDNYRCSDDVYLRKGGKKERRKKPQDENIMACPIP